MPKCGFQLLRVGGIGADIRFCNIRCLSGKGAGLYRHRLGGGCLFAIELRSRDRYFFNVKKWFTGATVKNKYIALFGDLSNSFNSIPILLYGNQIRRRGRVAVPEVVVDKQCVVALKLNKKGPARRPARQ
ncbi:MAG: hypothetical protein RIC19_21100 [Phaeodactylibacter sp.]